MSDTIKKIIPCNPYSKSVKEKSEQITNYLKAVIEAKDYELLDYDVPQFVDCGSNLEEINCPYCESALDFEWWGEAMENVSQNNFSNLTVELPCCGRECSMNGLNYNMPCGFASCEIDIADSSAEIDMDVLRGLSRIVNEELKVIIAHY